MVKEILAYVLTMRIRAKFCCCTGLQVERNYLALRSEPALERENEIGKLYTGYIVAVLDTSDPQYWMVYSWDLLKYGCVNKDYLVENSEDHSAADAL